MNYVWPVKAPAEVVERNWIVPVVESDSVASFTVEGTGVTVVASELNGDTIQLTLSAGSAGETATVDLVATSTNGLIETATFYQPVRADGFQLTPTGNEIANFALRKVVGNGMAADGVELDDALERLTDLLAGWQADGADLSVKLPVEAEDILYIPDWSVGAVKAVLTAKVFDHYDVPLTRAVAMDAQAGMQRIKARLLPDYRDGVEYF